MFPADFGKQPACRRGNPGRGRARPSTDYPGDSSPRDRISIDEHPQTRVWLSGLANGALNWSCTATPIAWKAVAILRPACSGPTALRAARVSSSIARRRKPKGAWRADATSFERAGLSVAATGFVPPAWLLSRQARSVVDAAGFRFHEILGGIVADGGLLARRLIGWGSLNAVEASVTCWWADIQRRRAPVDTRLAIHPADMVRPRTLASIRRALDSLVTRMAMLSYRDYLG